MERERAGIIEYKGEKIVYIDWSGLKPEEISQTLPLARHTISSQGKASVLTLTNVENALYNSKLIQEVKEFTAHNKPYVIAAALVGVTGLRKIMVKTVSKFSKRNFEVFNSLDEAKEWLVDQKKKINSGREGV